jgi:hypothetical protein
MKWSETNFSGAIEFMKYKEKADNQTDIRGLDTVLPSPLYTREAQFIVFTDGSVVVCKSDWDFNDSHIDIEPPVFYLGRPE